MRADRTTLIVAPRPRPGARHRLLCVPHAGAGPAAVLPLVDRLPEHVEVNAVNLRAAEGERASTDPRAPADLLRLADEVAAVIPDDGVDYTLFGYCAGALLAHLLAQRCRPGRLVVASFGAPDIAVPPRRLHDLPSAALWTVLLAQGGIPPTLDHADLRPVFEPALRNDFGLYAAYRHTTTIPIAAPITVLYGTHDPYLSRGALLGWRRHTRAEVDLCALPGGHWLFDEVPDEVAAVVAARLPRVGRA